MAKAFASVGDRTQKKISFTEVERGIYAFTAEGDPNTGVIIGGDAVMIVDTQSTPVMAQLVIDRVKSVTDKPIKYVVLSHYHAVRVLGTSAYHAEVILASDKCLGMIHERGEEDWASEVARFPRLFEAADSISGLTWPTMTFTGSMTVELGGRKVHLRQLDRAHTAGDIVAWIPDAATMCTGDIVEYKSTCYCGDCHFVDWPGTLGALAAYEPQVILPGRGDALQGHDKVAEALRLTSDFVQSTYRSVAAVVARGGSLKEAFAACRAACDEKFSSYAIYEHCLPFNVARAYDEAVGIDTPRIWTAERDRKMWEALQG
jgi:glyoxylase-like metal-dependent hydrolase (beta-lactamase superfamily II)